MTLLQISLQSCKACLFKKKKTKHNNTKHSYSYWICIRTSFCFYQREDSFCLIQGSLHCSWLHWAANAVPLPAPSLAAASTAGRAVLVVLGLETRVMQAVGVPLALPPSELCTDLHCQGAVAFSTHPWDLSLQQIPLRSVAHRDLANCF